jgi:hypothetical protein
MPSLRVASNISPPSTRRVTPPRASARAREGMISHPKKIGRSRAVPGVSGIRPANARARGERETRTRRTRRRERAGWRTRVARRASATRASRGGGGARARWRGSIVRWDVSEICGFSEMITVCPYGSTCVGATGDGTRGAREVWVGAGGREGARVVVVTCSRVVARFGSEVSRERRGARRGRRRGRRAAAAGRRRRRRGRRRGERCRRDRRTRRLRSPRRRRPR